MADIFEKVGKDLGMPATPQEALDTRMQEIGVPIEQEVPIVPFVETRKGFGETLGEAFELHNPTASALKYLDEPFFPAEPGFDFMQHRDEYMAGLPEQYGPEIAGSRSRAEAQWKRDSILMEQTKIRDLMDNGSHPIVATFVAALADPSTFVGGVGEAMVLSRILSKGARLKNALKTAGVTAASAVAQQAPVTAGQFHSDGEDMLYAGMFGLGMGFAAGAIIDPAALGVIDDAAPPAPAAPVLDDAAAAVPAPAPAAESIPVGTAAASAPPSRAVIPNVGKQEYMHAWVQTKEALRGVDPESERFVQLTMQEEKYRALMSGEKTMMDFEPSDAKLGETSIPVQTSASSTKKPKKKKGDEDLEVFDNRSDAPETIELGAKQMEFGPSITVKAELGDDLAFLTKDGTDEMAEIIESGKKLVKDIQKGMDDELVEEAAGRPVSYEPTDNANAFALDPSKKGEEIIERANQLEIEQGIEKRMTEGRTGWIAQAARFVSDSSKMLSMKSPVARYFAWHILENGAGLAGRTKSVAIIHKMIEPQLLAKAMPQMNESYAAWLAARKISKLDGYMGTTARDTFNRELRTELEKMRRAYYSGGVHAATQDPAILKAATAWQDMMDTALNIGKTRGVRGFDEIDRVPGYVPLKWLGSAMRRLDPVKKAQFMKLLQKGYAAALPPGVSSDDIERIASAVWKRAVTGDIGLDANPGALLSHDSREFLQGMLQNNGMTHIEIDELFRRIDGTMADRGKASFAKSRTDIDLTVTDEYGNSLLDLVDTDMQALGSRYASEIAGRSALTHIGIKDHSDWLTMRSTVLLDVARTGDDKDVAAAIMDATYDHLLGRPVGKGVRKNVRRFMEGAQAASLGMVGAAQLTEFAPILGAHGIGTMLKAIPALKKFRAQLRAGTVPDGVLGELRVHMGTIGDEQLLYRQAVRLGDRIHEDPAWLRVIDSTLAAANEQLGRISLLNGIQTIQQQFVVKMQADKVAKFLREGGDAKILNRFADMGWDEKFLARLRKQEQHFEVDGSGTLQRLNMEKWNDPELIEDFVTGLHRHSSQLIQRPLIGETAYWMHKTTGAMLTQFRTFPIVAIEKQTARHIKMMDEEAFYTTMYGLALSSMVVMAKAGVTSIGRPDRKEYLDERLSLEGIVKGAFQYAGVASEFTDMVNLAAAAGLAPASLAFNEIGRSGAARRLDIAGSDIPAVGFGVSAFNAAAGGIKAALYDDYTLSKKDVKAAQGATLLGNTLPGIMVFNAFEKAVK